MALSFDTKTELTETVTLVHRFGGNTMVVDLTDYLAHRRSRFADWQLSGGSAPDELKPAPTSVEITGLSRGTTSPGDRRVIELPRAPRVERRRRRRGPGGTGR